MPYQLKFEEIPVDDYERVLEVTCEETGLHALIAMHNTTLGPALGGTRAYPYKTRDDALNDVLRLSKGMTYKAAFAQTGTGGGKSVIIWDRKKPKTEALLRSFGQAVNTLEGSYICAEDVGMGIDDIEIVGHETNYAVGLPHAKSSGDPSPFTVRGGYLGILAACNALWGSPSVKGKTIAIQGLGATGWKLASTLFWEGAQLVVTDVHEEHIKNAGRDFGAKIVAPEDIYDVECDIFAPCALGGILNPDTIPRLKCRVVAGVANNQLLTDAEGEQLLKREILYAPDYVINSGGLICVCSEFDPEGYNAVAARDKLGVIYDFLSEVFERSLKEKRPTSEIADRLAEENIAKGVGKRQGPLVFHRE